LRILPTGFGHAGAPPVCDSSHSANPLVGPPYERHRRLLEARAIMDPITLLGLMLFATAATALIAVNWR
jgi:hypothetical protein